MRALPGAAPLFFARTDEELSLLCPTAALPEEMLLYRDDGWRALRVAGSLDFSLMGILSRLTGVIAQAGVPLSAVSTYDTDYLFIKEAHLPAALFALRQAGETVEAE